MRVRRIVPITIAFILICVGMVAAQAAPSSNAGGTGQWLVERNGSDASKLYVELRWERHDAHGYSNSNHSFDAPLASLSGLDAAALASAGTNAHFDIKRDAGTFQCVGYFANGNGSGHYTFVADPQFASALAQRGVGTPDADQQMRLALADVNLDLVDALKQAGYAFNVDELIRTANHGVNMQYVKGMQQLGYKPQTLAELTRMRDHGVDPEYVRELKAAGLGDESAEEVVRMRDHGVDAEYINGLAQHGIKGLSGDDLARLRDHGVTPEYIAAMQPLGRLDAGELTRMRDHGVTPEFANAVHSAGINASASDLARMRDHGVDADFITNIQKAGLANATPEQLERLRDHGVSASYVAQHKSLGVEEIIRRHDRGEENSMF